MSHEKTKGIVIKQSDFGEGDRMLSVFTEDFGIIKAVGRGARKTKGGSSSSGQFLCYGEFDFYCGGEIWNVNSFTPKESFAPLQYDIKKLSLASYFAELTFTLLDLKNIDKAMLRLLLNTLYALSYKDIDLRILKLVFELKSLSFSGFLPRVSECIFCGEKEVTAFDIKNSGTVCRECETDTSIKIGDDSLSYLKFILGCEQKKMFSFAMPENVIAELSYISERYLKNHIDKELKSLLYYKKL